MDNRGKRDLFKPSKELLEELLLYVATKDIAQLINVNKKTLEGYIQKHGINAIGLRYKREFLGRRNIPGELIRRLEIERGNHEKKISETTIKLDPDECLVVPDEVFAEPELVTEEQPETTVFNTSDIANFIKSGNVLGWLYSKPKSGQSDFYGGYLGVANRRNSKGPSDRNFNAVKLA